MLARFFLGFLWITISGCLAASAACQEPATGLRFTSFTRAAHGQAQPGGWLVLTASFFNSSNQTVTGTVVATVGGVGDTQSARSISFLPNCEQQVDVYVQVPQSLETEDYAEVELTLYHTQAGREVIADVDGAPMRHSLRLPIVREPNTAFTVIETEPPYFPYWYWPFREAHSNYELVASSRVASGNSRGTVGLIPRTVPLNMSDWGEVGLVVVSDPELFNDAAAVEALNRFVNNGGRIWVMVDQVPCSLVRPLLAPGQLCEEVDEVELNSFSVEMLRRTQDFSEQDLQVSIDKPARMKRVMQFGGRISHEVNGWPAAIWMNVGYGQVLLTTLESHAWLEAGSETQDILQATDFKTRPWAQSLATNVHDTLHEKPLASLVGYPLQLIGNPVLPRMWVGLGLLGFIALLSVVGAIQWKLGDSSHFGWLAPLISVIVGGALFVAAGWIRRDIPETVATLQVIHASQDGRTATIREQGALYLDSQRSMQLSSAMDGHAQADPSVQSGIHRFTTQDFQQWQLSNTAWPPGSWRYQAEFAEQTQDLTATATLSEAGLKIELPDAFQLEDPVVSFIPGSPMVGTRVDRYIIADGSLIADADRWIDGALISDEQRRRLEVYQAFFSPNDRVPTLPHAVYGWTERWDTAAWSESKLARTGSALVSLPIRLLRPEPGAQLSLPFGMARIRKNQELLSRTSVYSDVTGKWTPEVSLAVDSSLQIVLPPEVLPFEAEAMTIELDIKAPRRTVRILSNPDAAGEAIEIVKLQGPSIPWQAEITDPRVLADARDGLVNIELEVSDRNDKSQEGSSNSVVTWQIDSFRASFRGSRTSE